MADLGTPPGDFASIAVGISGKAQVVGTSFDANFNPRAFIWQNGVMTDLNSFTPAGSTLFLLWANKINARGEIVGVALDTTTNESHAYLASPDRDAEAAQKENSYRPRVVVPENVRKLLHPRLRMNHFAAPPILPH